MGYITIIELNHDMYTEIFENDKTKQEFLHQISEQFRCFKYNGERINGGQVIAGFHQSDAINNRWSKFKKRVQNKEDR